MSKKPSVKDRAMLAMQAPSPLAVGSATGDVGAPVKVRTGPGAFVAHLARESEVFGENQVLKNELKFWADATPAKKLDPSCVLPSKWTNRHSDSFENADFLALKADIESAGGNIQAIKVRPIPGSDPQRYEIVFGHRRHRACLELNLPVLALIESINEQALFVEMDRENRQRSDLRPYEQGEMYRRALDEGLYGSLRKLAEAIGVQPSNVSVAIKIARLPDDVLNAFPSRLDIQYRWALPLTDAVEKEPDLVLKKAKAIAASKADAPHSAVDVYRLLAGTGKEAPDMTSDKARAVMASKVVVKKKGNKMVFEIDNLSKHNSDRIHEAILRILTAL